jgi:hypothetical protein
MDNSVSRSTIEDFRRCLPSYGLVNSHIHHTIIRSSSCIPQSVSIPIIVLLWHLFKVLPYDKHFRTIAYADQFNQWFTWLRWPRSLRRLMCSTSQTIGRGFESHSRHRCMLPCPVWVQALLWADPPSEEIFQLSKHSWLLKWNRPEGLILKSGKVEEEIVIYSSAHRI